MGLTDGASRRLLGKQLQYEHAFVHRGQGCGLQECVAHKFDLAQGEQIRGLSGKNIDVKVWTICRN